MNRAILTSVFKQFLNDPDIQTEKNARLRKYDDQALLSQYLVPVMNGKILSFEKESIKSQIFYTILGSSLAHDSYSCGRHKFEETRPFPVQRQDGPYNFVGAVMYGHVQPYKQVTKDI